MHSKARPDAEAPDIDGFGIGPGGAFGSTRATAAPGDPDRAFAYLLSDTVGGRPLAGASLPEEAVSYTLGSDIYPVSPGQILQIYEIDGNRRVTAWTSIRIEAHHLQDQTPPTVGSVTGTVYGAGNAPLSGATVTAGGIVGSTNGEGRFALQGVAEGVHTLAVSARGYQAYSTTVNVVAGTTADAGRIVMRTANASGPSNGPNPSQGSSPQPPAPEETTLKINGKDVRVPFAKERENAAGP